MNTLLMLMVTYNDRPDLDVKTVADNHFNLTEGKLLKKVENDEIDLPVIRLEDASQKARRIILLADLADFLDRKADEARRAMGR
ncbi:pyocin activator PrtN family protein [uncultured Roseovarius sp.]|uniref:pyocin activator PrtN family protein n=1 Tax=uncultured Roseovarius sp. TaxID=293344 RepID=UPI0026107D4A|nr:pyocin activator PrtN family protein [uncultured Roseovarius sp.]